MVADAVSRLERALEQGLRLLKELGVSHALIGGLAVSARAEPRFTRDVDLAVAVRDDQEAEALVFEFQRRGFRTLASVEQESTGRLATARLVVPMEAGGVLLDLLFASSGIEQEIAVSAEPLEVFPGLVMPVARAGHLIALKVLARDDRRRPQDLMDLLALLRSAPPEELERAHKALVQIQHRGCARGKDLLAELADAQTLASS
jgi:hypothetical protein